MRMTIDSLASCWRLLVATLTLNLALVSCASLESKPGEDSDTALIQPQETAVAPTASLDEEDLYELLLADLSAQRGDYATAADTYLRLAKRTRDVALVESATRSALQANNSKQAIAALELWLDIDPQDERALALVTRIYVSEGRSDEAYRHLQQIRESRAKEEGKGFLYVARLLSRSREQEAATALMERLSEGYDNDADALFAQSFLALQFGDYDRAAETIERVLALRGDNVQALLHKALILRRQNKAGEAADILAQVVEQQPENNDLRSSYARMLVEAGRYQEAREQYQLLIQQAPDNEDILFALGLLSLQLEQVDEAEAHFMELQRRGSDNPDVPYYLARIAESREDLNQALFWYSQVTDGSNYPDAQLRIAVLMALQGDLAAARSQLGVIRTNIPAMALEVTLTEGSLLQEAERHDEAIALYTEALQALTGNTRLLYARGLAYAETERFNLFEEDMRDILQSEPDNADALNALGYYLADSTTRYEEALGYIERALAQRPDSHFVIDSYGWVQYRLGNHAEALKYLRKAFAIEADPEVAAHLGEVLWMTGERDEARRIWNEALERDPENKALRKVVDRFLK